MKKGKKETPVRENNVEFLTRLMEFSRFGPLMQGFIIGGLEKYAELVIAEEPPKDEDHGTGIPLIPWSTWVACAEEVKKEIGRAHV